MNVSLWLLVFIGIMVLSLVGVMLYIRYRLRGKVISKSFERSK